MKEVAFTGVHQIQLQPEEQHLMQLKEARQPQKEPLMEMVLLLPQIGELLCKLQQDLQPQQQAGHPVQMPDLLRTEHRLQRIPDLRQLQDRPIIELKVRENTRMLSDHIRAAGAIIRIQGQVLHPGRQIRIFDQVALQGLHLYIQGRGVVLQTDLTQGPAVAPIILIHDQAAVRAGLIQAREVLLQADHLPAIQEAAAEVILRQVVPVVAQADHTAVEVHQEAVPDLPEAVVLHHLQEAAEDKFEQER